MNNAKFILFVLILIFQPAFTQSYQELQKLQSEYKKILERQSLQKPKDITNAEEIAKSTVIPDKLVYSRKDIESLLVNTEKLLKQLKFLEDSTNKMPYVGYDFFTKRDSIPFWQNLPLSKNYVLGAGDEIIISLWGESNSSNIETVNRDGQIFIEKIGILNLGGKTIGEAKDYIISKFSPVYSTLAGDNPRSFIDLTLGELKSINVHFVGYVNIPGVHMVHPFSNVITGLIQAGGVDIKGSLRDIKIIRNNKEISSTDFYNYFFLGKPLEDLRLMDQDIVYVSSRKNTIPVSGKILQPGYFEILEKENLNDLINFSGGFDRKSSKFIFVYRNSVSDDDSFILKKNQAEAFKIFQGDSIYFPEKPNFQNFIKVGGQVKIPGDYPYSEQMRLKDIIEATMSLQDDQYKETMNLSDVKIFRKNPLNQNPLIIDTSIQENILLKNGDHITVPRSKMLEQIESVVITGEIMVPGIYPVNKLTTLSDILILSGGLNDMALKDGIEIFRDSLKIAWNNENFILSDGDSLNVLKKNGLVQIKGEVNVPGYVTYKKNESVKYYIKKAGGYTSYAEEKNIFIVYPNGTSIPFSSFPRPKVKEGSIITVSQRTLSSREAVSGWQLFSAISSQAGSIATTLISLSLLINQNNNAN